MPGRFQRQATTVAAKAGARQQNKRDSPCTAWVRAAACPARPSAGAPRHADGLHARAQPPLHQRRGGGADVGGGRVGGGCGGALAKPHVPQSGDAQRALVAAGGRPERRAGRRRWRQMSGEQARAPLQAEPLQCSASALHPTTTTSRNKQRHDWRRHPSSAHSFISFRAASLICRYCSSCSSTSSSRAATCGGGEGRARSVGAAASASPAWSSVGRGHSQGGDWR